MNANVTRVRGRGAGIALPTPALPPMPENAAALGSFTLLKRQGAATGAARRTGRAAAAAAKAGEATAADASVLITTKGVWIVGGVGVQ